MSDKMESVCAEADRLVSTDRQADYGHPADDYARTVAIFKLLTGKELTAAEGVKFMIAVKLSREANRHKRDNLVDACGYLKCLDLIIERETNP